MIIKMIIMMMMSKTIPHISINLIFVADRDCVHPVSSGGTLSSVCSCVVCTNEYSSGNSNKGPQTKNMIKHPTDTQVRRS